MSNTRYIELDSTYRNRVLYPLPADFKVQVSQYGYNDRFNALDPVSDAAPLEIFDGNFNLAGGDFITGTVSALTDIGAITDVSEVIVEFPAGTLKRDENFYVGAVLNDTTTGELRRITDYVFQESGAVDRGLFKIEPSYRLVSAGDSITITNPSSNVGPFGHIFIPFGMVFDKNFYINMVIEDETIGETRKITAYSSSTSVATLASPFSGAWSSTDSYVIRKVAPRESGTLTASTINSFTFPATFSTTFQQYTGSFIRITSGPASGDIRRIVRYSDPVAPSTTGTVNPSFSAIPGLADFEILPFTRDNAVPFNYTGSLVSQQQEVCYEVELLNLILPNRDLDVFYGNRIAFHPYVYVEFSSTENGVLKDIIYSNNPNSTKALFRVPIDDVTNPLITSFLKVDGDGSVQTIQFKPNDTLKFRVFMPNGETFKTVDPEFFSPRHPNPLIQISAEFAIRRVA